MDKKLKKLPVYKKANEIRKIVEAIVKFIDPKKDEAEFRYMLWEDACIMGAKIAGAEGGDLYFIRMENAVLIKVAARNLLVNTNYLRSENLCPEEYIQLLRNEIDEFRLLFIDWVNTFDRLNGRDDEWGDLFA